jgi:PAS domain S-box-containing protein
MPESSNPSALHRIIGISETSARKSYYPILQRTIAELQAEVAERKQAEAALRATVQRIERQQRAVLRLPHIHAANSLDAALAAVCTAVAQAMELTRAAVWRLTDNALAPMATNGFPSLSCLTADVLATFPAKEVLAMEGSCTDTRLQVLWERLGQPGALIATLVCDNHGPWGLITGEASSPRTWFADETAFLGRMAEHVALVLAEHETQRLRALLTRIVDSMPSALITVDAQGCVTQWNRHAETLTGTPATQALGRPLAEAAPLLAAYSELAAQAMATHTPQSRTRQARSDGTRTRFEDVTIYPLEQMEGAVIRIDDVTERQHMEQLLIQSEKMLSLGGLAAGMAHEINNPLASILGSIQVLASRLSAPLPANLEAAAAANLDFDALQRYLAARDIPSLLTAIQDAGRRAATLVTGMLGFSRKTDPKLVPTDLGEVIRSTIELARMDYDLKKNYDFRRIAVDLHIDPDLPAVPCSQDKIQQVLLNLLRNGAEAMAEKAYPPGDGPRFTIRAESAHDGVRIRVADNGPGMEPDILARSMEPFFTTKPPGKGTGLGLSVSYFIITQEHGGRMYAESTPGQGSCFTIELPQKPANKNGGPKASAERTRQRSQD